MSHRECRRLGGGGRLAIGVGGRPVGRGRSGVGDRAGIQVGLGDGVGGGAGQALPRIEEGVEVADGGHRRAALVGGAVVGDGDRPGQRDVAGVGDQEAVADDIPDRVVGITRGDALDQGQGSAVWVAVAVSLIELEVDAASGGGGGVGDRAGVEVGLGDDVGGGAGEALTGIEEGVEVADGVDRRAASRRSSGRRRR